MQKIAIIGAGQSGLQLAIGLLNQGYSVSLFSDKTARQILEGKILSSQCMFGTTIAYEKILNINFWGNDVPINQAVTFSLLAPDTFKRAIYWQGKTDKPFHSIDQRIKFSKWMEVFQAKGGDLYIEDVKLTDLDSITQTHALTIIATGKGALGNIFPRDEKRSYFDKPQRQLSCIYLKNVMPAQGLQGVRAHILPGIGEYFNVPGLTINEVHCEMMLVEGLENSPFDCWRDISHANQLADRLKNLLKQFIPWEYERIINAMPTDDKAWLAGSYTPIVRQPCVQLKNGKHVLGIGDAVMLNDPIAGQGANNAGKAAYVYTNSILDRGKLPFDANWMQQTFETFWETYGQYATDLTRLLLLPPSPHLVRLFNEAANFPKLAAKLANAFDRPADLFPWILNEEATADQINYMINHKVSSSV